MPTLKKEKSSLNPNQLLGHSNSNLSCPGFYASPGKTEVFYDIMKIPNWLTERKKNGKKTIFLCESNLVSLIHLFTENAFIVDWLFLRC